MNINILEFIKPELLMLVPALYFIGIALKMAVSVADKYIPLVLGGLGMVLALLWVLGAVSVSLTMQGWLMAAFTAIVQGWLAAGMSVYANQLLKQMSKKGE